MERITIKINVPVDIEEKEGVFIASCKPLDVFTQGTTMANAEQNIIEALDLFLSTCAEMGTLEQVLNACGFKPEKNSVAPLSPHGKYVDIPLPFICANHNNILNKCHA